MRVTIFGHAGLYIETIDQRILLDPYFDNQVLGGVLTFNPGRVLDVEQIPTPTVIVVTHAHFDHFHIESLKKLPRDIPLITANDLPLIEELKAHGFSNIIVCQAWQLVQIGKTTFFTTPSEHEEEELGLLIKDEDGSFWHIADSEVNTDIGERIVNEFGSIDLISAKYQPSVRAMIGYLRNMGAAFDKEEMLMWLETACSCNPGLVFPYASGICFDGRHEWFNRYAFPISSQEVIDLLQRRLGSQERVTDVLPGDVIEIKKGEKPKKYVQASPFIRAQASPEIVWEPIEVGTLAGVATTEEKIDLQKRLEAFLQGPLALWLQRKVQQGTNAIAEFRYLEVVWQLTVHVGSGERLNYFVDFRSSNFAATPGEHPQANFFSHISGQSLYEVIKGELPGIMFWLTGSVRNYEKIMGVRDGSFWLPHLAEAPQNRMSDPLTYYLRHFGAGELSPNEPDLEGINIRSSSDTTAATHDLEVLARQGGNREVMSKKALLAYLALQEVERTGIEITDEEIQTVSDAFRRQFGLQDSDDTEKWLQAAGLSLEAYASVMRNFTAVLKLEKQYAQKIEPLLTEHHLIATAETFSLHHER
jgi:hypothetical protein